MGAWAIDYRLAKGNLSIPATEPETTGFELQAGEAGLTQAKTEGVAQDCILETEQNCRSTQVS